MAEKANDLTSSKGKKKRSYIMEFEKQVVVYAETNSICCLAFWRGTEKCKRMEERFLIHVLNHGVIILNRSNNSVLMVVEENALMKI